MNSLRELSAKLDELIEFGYGDSILKKMGRTLSKVAKQEGTSVMAQRRNTLRLRIAAAAHVKAARPLAERKRIETADAIKVVAGLGLKTKPNPRAVEAANKTLKKLGARKITIEDVNRADSQLRKKAYKDFSARLDELIELGHGLRNHPNPLFDASVHSMPLKPRRLTGGVEQSIPLSRIISGQKTVRGRQVRSIKEKLLRGTLESRATLPMVQRVGSRYVAHDGNHFLAGALRAGKRKALVLVQ